MVSSGCLTVEEAEKILSEQQKISNIYIKLSPKGCVSIYGIRRMPISLYPDELDTILKYFTVDTKFSNVYQQFLLDNQSLIKPKITKKRPTAPSGDENNDD